MFVDFFLPDQSEVPSEFALVRVSRRAMATRFEVAIPAGSHHDPVAAAEGALDLIDELETQLTVYRDDSEVAQLNQAAANGFVEIEPRLFDLLSRCAGWTKETGGAFDIATGALTKAWGFFRREPGVPTHHARNEAMRASGTRHVLLDPVRCAVKFRVRGLELNLGAVGKGYALDRAAELLRVKCGVRSALLHAGGSSAYAIGFPPGDARGWPIDIRHPKEASGSLGTLYLRDAGLGTSAATFQFFEYKGQQLGHLLDPRRGWPASGIASASVVAPTAAEADAMSTAAFVLGAAGAEALTRLRPALGALVLPEELPALHSRPNRNGEAPESRLASPKAREVLYSPFDSEKSTRNGLWALNLPPGAFSPTAHVDHSQ
ncbi:FAD:protein FMN transferase [Gemmata sp. JC717]|uniref:FAD:protein FMN transferase n=1 Tax=Gemmata algarum TaxID=2975278 RepID=UPI0028E0A2F2|nr:FAD:protein FMN transferase [Gemmata algarum]MDY3556367.1 FAD:protein FMN transferase [Gemmata algarum]